MLVNRVQAEFIGTNRIDPDFYRPEHLADEKHLRHFGSDKLGSIGHFVAGPFGSKLPSELYLSAGIPLFRVGNVGSMEVLLNGMAYLAPEVHEDLNDSEVNPGDLLIVKASVGEKICRVPTWMPRANITQHIIGIRPNGHVDMDYITAFLFCQYGRRQLVRRSLGSIIQYLGITDSKDVLFPRIKSLAQKYIGEKVRQSERLREHARTLETDVSRIHAQHTVQPIGIDFDKRTRRLAARSLTERLDAHFYPSAVEQYFRHFKLATQSLNRLCLLVANGQSQPESAEGVRQVTVTNLKQSFVGGLMRTVQRPTDGSPTLAPHDLLLCNAAHEKSYIGRDVTYSQVDGPFPSTEVMVVRVDRTQIPASFVRHHLKTQIGYLQIQSTIRGITAHSYPTDVKLIEIPIPTVPDAERPAWFAADDKMLEAGRCFDAANILTSVATVLVEAIIEGKVIDTELVTAQEALERGDNTADRFLLRRLTREGFDIADQPPLFPDLDALYALLAQAKEATQ
jgi:type I restriction enzyme S subunit